jgi:hypothetical protein
MTEQSRESRSEHTEVRTGKAALDELLKNLDYHGGPMGEIGLKALCYEAASCIRALLARSETASRNAAPQEGAGSPAGPAANGELAVAAFINDLPIPEEFHALASFYDVKDLSSLVRMQQEHIEGLQAKLPPTPTFPGPQRVREG